MKTTRDFMVESVMSYSRLNLYRDTTVEEVNKWAALSSQAFQLSELDSLNQKEQLIRTHFVINPIMREFIESLKRFRKHFLQSSIFEDKKYYGQVRGRIDWNKTIKLRMTSGGMKSPYFVCSSPRRNYDLSENILLKFLLVKFKQMIERVIKESPKVKDENWTHELHHYLSEINKTLDISALSSVSNRTTIDQRILQRIKSSQKPHYRNLYYIYKIYRRIFIYKHAEAEEAILSQFALVNSKIDKLYEVFILFQIYDYLSRFALKREFNIMGAKASGKDLTTTFYFSEGTLKVSAQSLPRPLKQISKYKALINQTLDYSNPPRNPDIVFTWYPNQTGQQVGRHYVLIELKYSIEEDYYRKSVYKVLGYLKDFEEGLKCDPKGILIFDANIGSTFQEELWITNTMGLYKSLEKLLTSWGIDTNVITIQSAQ